MTLSADRADHVYRPHRERVRVSPPPTIRCHAIQFPGGRSVADARGGRACRSGSPVVALSAAIAAPGAPVKIRLPAVESGP